MLSSTGSSAFISCLTISVGGFVAAVVLNLVPPMKVIFGVATVFLIAVVGVGAAVAPVEVRAERIYLFLRYAPEYILGKHHVN